MNLSNFTVKAAEVVQGAQQGAFNNKNSNIETEHLLKALLDGQDSPVEYLLKKNGVPIQQLDTKLDEQFLFSSDQTLQICKILSVRQLIE